jgi:prepilin-type N-terminal cleavage/methylation domain-containing protein/prepilin-type processing-associated H-X9-DG protein
MNNKHQASAVRNTRGFTLIEILVVVGIIALLAAILFPVLARVREGGKRTVCISNLKQLATAARMYSQDYAQTYMPIQLAAAADVSPTNPYGWADAMQSYVKNIQLYQCPSETRPPCGAGHGLPVDPTLNKLKPADTTTTCGYTDYMMNAALGEVMREQVKSPTQTILFTEGGGNMSRVTGNGCRTTAAGSATDAIFTSPFGCASTAAGVLDNRTGSRHLDGYNFAFADGHVKWFKMPADKIYNLFTPAAQANGGATYSIF